MFVENLEFIYFGNFKQIHCRFQVPNTCLVCLWRHFESAKRENIKIVMNTNKEYTYKNTHSKKKKIKQKNTYKQICTPRNA